MDLIVDLLSVGTKWKLFQFNRALYEQTDEVTMGSPLGPLLANVLMSSIEENFEQEGKLPSFYWRYVNNMLTMTLNIAIASNFLDTLNKKGTFLCKIYDGNQLQWHASISGFPVTEAIASSRDKGIHKTH